jgi:DNA-binding transcriptional regulator GbsR (MarR family)
MGLRYEEDGFPRMAGRLAGWLLVCEPPHQTARQLAEVLGVSPGSISAMTRVLLQCGCVEKIAVPGQRSACYRMRTGAWTEMMNSLLVRTRKKRILAEEGLRLTVGRSPESRQRLAELHDFQAFIERELPAVLRRWEEESSR